MMTEDTRPLVQVVAGILLDKNGRYLLSSRPEGKPYAGYWEFAGGKVEAGESDFQALQREFEEELGIRILAATPWLTKVHSYEHAHVRLHFLWVEADQWTGEIQSREGQKWAWQKAGDFTVAPMLPANSALLRSLSIPRQLQGRLKSGLSGQNSMGEYHVVPYMSAQHQTVSAVLLEFADWQQGKPIESPNVWPIIENVEQWQQVQNADAVVWKVANEAAAKQVVDILAQGVAMPLIAAAPESMVSIYREQWRSMGAHAVLTDNDIEAV
ncbi:NTP pyrophosphohydrolase [Neisseria sp. HMSC061E12]|jgi:mutator mutT|nr:NTP pyrophosphohydrolase [Neisseria sp. HMSC061E12]OFP75390.1 NTP pyrophosphohydrolase [Neisseria sp. HMSC066B07]OHO86554.1 NTP pyrophosphohydrolase [Neisseria sp. HMSC056A04]OHQ24683.1 NTP pyrophosphohydrolase [Neisseria sp. HMSC066F04]OHR20732.1 NTP pyrophosphohydrolase [Neisseria sp. HMSC078H04]